ncbi:hypothetical protein BZG36_03138 [Bifiguratus adelaidae]|uniref:Oxidation resistance protein 1 n=1 Tax=Bifiguratus adelaidae TaxID=1938954 RepID=A0A261XXD6_9FUNG|nr:hypothetical protein BZG36_03138 [Bifiguratus adelaidae]
MVYVKQLWKGFTGPDLSRESISSAPASSLDLRELTIDYDSDSDVIVLGSRPDNEKQSLKSNVEEGKQKPPTLLGRDPTTDPVIDVNMATQLRPFLPPRFKQASKWKLLYSLDQHGISLTTLYHKAKVKGPQILAIKDDNDDVFGAFLNESLRPSPTYYGTGESFLWKVIGSNENSRVKIYPWTGRNEYMILCDPGFIGVGGGDGKFGLWLHANLETGHSESCQTFNNELLSRQPDFTCVELEVWAFEI